MNSWAKWAEALGVLALLVFRDVWKRYPGGAYGLRGASFSIPEGVVAGLVGPNGSGKTTTLKLAMGFLKPSRGSLEVLGANPYLEEDVRSLIGFLPERPVYPMDVSVEHLLAHKARLMGLQDPYTVARRAAGMVGLDKHLGKPIGSLSRGYIQRLGLAYALIGEPRLLLLDEPTANLDPATRNQILDLIASIVRDTGATAVVSTHVLPEAQRIARYIVILVDGVVAAEGHLPGLAEKLGTTRYYSVEAGRDSARRVAAILIEHDGVVSVRVSDGARLVVEASRSIDDLLEELQQRGLVLGFHVETASLEDLYQRIVRGTGA